jgi:phage tail-like protein
MAEFSATASRSDPYKNFRFRVKWDGRYVAGVSRMSGLKRTSEITDRRKRSDAPRGGTSSGRARFEPMTLERGVTHDVEFERWASEGSSRGTDSEPDAARRDLLIEMSNEVGQLVVAYTVLRARVSNFQALPHLDSDINAVTIESITLENEGWERVHDVTEPPDPALPLA